MRENGECAAEIERFVCQRHRWMEGRVYGTGVGRQITVDPFHVIRVDVGPLAPAASLDGEVTEHPATCAAKIEDTRMLSDQHAVPPGCFQREQVVFQAAEPVVSVSVVMVAFTVGGLRQRKVIHGGECFKRRWQLDRGAVHCNVDAIPLCDGWNHRRKGITRCQLQSSGIHCFLCGNIRGARSAVFLPLRLKRIASWIRTPREQSR